MENYRVMKTEEFEDAVYYEAACSCGNSGHNLKLEFEKDSRFPDMIFLNFYKDLYWSSHWGDEIFFKRWWKRIKGAFRILFVGYIEVEECFILQGDAHINSFIKALEKGRDKFK